MYTEEGKDEECRAMKNVKNVKIKILWMPKQETSNVLEVPFISFH